VITLPNWCENELRVFAKNNKGEEEIAEFKEWIKKETFDFAKIIPYPQKFADTDRKAREWEENANKFAKENGAENWYKLGEEKTKEFIEANGQQPKDGYNQGGYDWCIENWGTKWGAHEVVVEEEFDNPVIFFDTAWSPPRPIVIALSKKYPNVDFCLNSYECGAAFQYGLRANNGKVKEEGSAPYFGGRGG
jgi:hypothetical protein